MNCGGDEGVRISFRYGGIALSASLLTLVFSFLFGAYSAEAQDVDKLIDPVLATHRFSEVAISPDGKRVAWVEMSVRSDTEYAKAVYLADALTGAHPTEIEASGTKNRYGVAWSPDSTELAFLAEGNSSNEVSLKVASRSNIQQLAMFPGEVQSVSWSPDGRTISLLYSPSPPSSPSDAHVMTIGKDFRQQRIALVDRSSGQMRLLTPVNLFVYQYDWSADSLHIAATAAPCCSGSDGNGDDNWWTAGLYTIDAGSGNASLIHKPKWQIASPKWSPNGRRIAFICGLMSDFIAPGGDLCLIDADGKNWRNATPALPASISWISWTAQDKILATEIVDGSAGVATIHPDSGSTDTLWQGTDGPYTGGLVFALSVANDGRTSAAVRETFAQPPEIWTGPIGRWRQLTSVNQAQTPSWGKAESVHWNSDKSRIQGWLLYPANYVSTQKYPMVVLVHGGPAAAALNHWALAFDDVEILSSLGYFVLYPNARGSMGQGEDFTQANVKDLGYGDLRDIEAGVKYVIQNFPVDPQRVGITGWSYGGYMSMWAITQTNMFRASVAGPGVSNWQSYYGQVDIEKWLIPYFGASPYDDPAIYARSSPINFVKNTHAATLFYVGNEDSVCPAPQTFELWRALKHMGIDTKLLFYPAEGHGISLPVDQRDITRQTAAWFSEHLR
jgi:dipeptidyl aminopeptidase/acylaminoacyl peptidase